MRNKLILAGATKALSLIRFVIIADTKRLRNRDSYDRQFSEREIIITTIFLGGIKNLLQNNKKSQNPISYITESLSKSNIGLHKTNTSGTSTSSKSTANTSNLMDSFDISKTISDLLSPACGMTEEEKSAYFNKIMAKLKSGKKLSTEEMRFLQAEYPELYQQAARVQAMREGLENRLKACHSKEEAQTMFADALSHVSDDDPMKEAITASYMDAMNEFQKSDEYRELPDTAEEAELENKIS